MAIDTICRCKCENLAVIVRAMIYSSNLRKFGMLVNENNVARMPEWCYNIGFIIISVFHTLRSSLGLAVAHLTPELSASVVIYGPLRLTAAQHPLNQNAVPYNLAQFTANLSESLV